MPPVHCRPAASADAATNLMIKQGGHSLRLFVHVTDTAKAHTRIARDTDTTRVPDIATHRERERVGLHRN